MSLICPVKSADPSLAKESSLRAFRPVTERKTRPKTIKTNQDWGEVATSETQRVNVGDWSFRIPHVSPASARMLPIRPNAQIRQPEAFIVSTTQRTAEVQKKI